MERFIPTQSWVLKAKYALEGVIYEYDESKGQAADEFDKIRAVPADRVVATFEGSWKGQIWWKRKGEKVRFPLPLSLLWCA